MAPQYLAAGTSHEREVATLPPQHLSCARYVYLFAAESAKFHACRIRAALRQAGSLDRALNENKTWRQRCPRASKHSWPWALLHLSQHAQTPHRLKSTWSLTPRQFRPSRNTPANTSNFGYTRFGQALRPVQPVRLSRYPAHSCAPLQKGGAV